MKKSKFSEEQIAYVLRQVESGTPPADVCRQMGVSEATFYIWKKKYAHLGVSDLAGEPVDSVGSAIFNSFPCRRLPLLPPSPHFHWTLRFAPAQNRRHAR